jgi:hypothetical protein
MIKLRQRVVAPRPVQVVRNFATTRLLVHLYVGFGAPVIDLPQRPFSRKASPAECTNLLMLRKSSRTLTTGLELPLPRA